MCPRWARHIGTKSKYATWAMKRRIRRRQQATATGPAGALYNQGTVNDVVSFSRMNDAMAEYVGVLLGPVASKAVRILTRPVNTIGGKSARK